jgi:metal-sulfur cluster biosynthetic enzyme
MDNSAAITEEQIYEVLRECYDPEIPVNIVDLGLVYGVSLTGRVINVSMTLTAPGCSMGEIVWDPPWTPHMITPAARKQLGIDD